jgi:MraZ protein
MQRTGTTRFIGRYYHALEQKGRVSIPKTFRQSLGETAVITRGLDGCLYLFESDNWQAVAAQAASMPLTQGQARAWVRLLAHNASEVRFDHLGRILINDDLRQQAGLSKDVVIVGSLTHIEIWDRATYHTYLDKISAQAEAIAESLTNSSLIESKP